MAEETWKDYKQTKHAKPMPLQGIRVLEVGTLILEPVGFDNEYVMTKHLSKNKDQIKALYECGAIGKWGDIRGRRPPEDWDGKSGLIMARDAEESEILRLWSE